MLRSGFLLVCILGLATAAQAYFTVSAGASGDAWEPTGDVVSFGQQSGTHSFPEAAVPMEAAGGVYLGLSSATATASATFGTLKASSSASASADGAIGRSHGGSSVHDTLHVQSSTLANGTPVSLPVVFYLSGRVLISEAVVLHGGNRAGAIAKFLAITDVPSPHALHLDYSNAIDGFVAPIFGTLAAQVGDTVLLDYQTSANSGADGSPTDSPLGASVRVTLNGSVRISIDEATPDVTLIADSGYDYTQTVPEPSAAASLGAALVSLLGIGVVRVRGGRV